MHKAFGDCADGVADSFDDSNTIDSLTLSITSGERVSEYETPEKTNIEKHNKNTLLSFSKCDFFQRRYHNQERAYYNDQSNQKAKKTTNSITTAR